MQALLACMLLLSLYSTAQQKPKSDTSNKVNVDIVYADYAEYVQTDTNSFNKLVGDVQLKQGDSKMYCDSAYLNIETNNVEAFGDVVIVQPDGTRVTGDYLRYIGNEKLAYMIGNVNLTDGKDNLWADQVVYDMTTKVGTYSNGGTLQTGTTTLSSDQGVYNLRSKDARFTQNVLVYDPEYEISSMDMGYNTQTKIVVFYAHSIVTSDKSVLITICGTYDTEKEIAHFPCRSSSQTEEQYIESDSSYYDRGKGVGLAVGNVIAIDTVQKSTLYCGRADIDENAETMLASIKPVLKKMNGDDSLFIRADTFFSAPVAKEVDSIEVVKVVGKGKKKKEVVQMVADTTQVDTVDTRYFTCYHNVMIFSDSLQGRCDSLVYTDVDSVMRLIYDPVLWSRKSQITGDTILLYMDSSNLKKMYVPSKSFVVSQSGPEKAQLFDQIQGKTLTGFFHNGVIDEIVVKPNAETIYYSKDDNDAYIGVNEASSARLRIVFKDEQIDFILFEQDVQQKMTPLLEADLANMKLKRFIWLDEKRPRSLQELFE